VDIAVPQVGLQEGALTRGGRDEALHDADAERSLFCHRGNTSQVLPPLLGKDQASQRLDHEPGVQRRFAKQFYCTRSSNRKTLVTLVIFDILQVFARTSQGCRPALLLSHSAESCIGCPAALFVPWRAGSP
jgi:hypothetical protein